MAWNIFVLFTIVVVIFLIGLGIKSLIMKWKANPQSKFDLLPGIVISVLAIAGLIYIFIETLNKITQ